MPLATPVNPRKKYPWTVEFEGLEPALVQRVKLPVISVDSVEHGSSNILVKTGSMDELLDLVEAQPEAYFKPAYYGASGWIGVILNRPDVDWDNVASWLERSWRQVAPKSATRLIDVADEF